MKILIFIILLGCANLFAGRPNKSSFVWALKNGMEKIGLNISYDQISVYMGTAFAAAIDTNQLCFFAGAEKADEVFFENFLENTGLNCKQVVMTPKLWNRAMIRQYFRGLIKESIANTNLVLVKGGWEFPLLTTDWAIVNSVRKDGSLLGIIKGKSVIQDSVPEKLIIISATNTYVLRKQPQILLEAAINLLKNENKEINECVLTGTAAIDIFANNSHRKPFCLKCKKASAVCAKNFLYKYYNELKSGVNYLHSLAKSEPVLSNSVDELTAICGKIKTMRFSFSNVKEQAVFGEKIRALNLHQIHAANYLSMFCGKSNKIKEKFPEFYRDNESKFLAQSLPLFSNIKDGNNSFFCSTLIASQLAGIKKNRSWIKGCYGAPFKFLINKKSCMPPVDNTQGIDCSGKLFAALGYDHLRYHCGPTLAGNPESKYLRQKIKKSINRGFPLIVSYSNGWGVMVGFVGNKFICRMPDDSNMIFNVKHDIPVEFFEFGEKTSENSNKNQIKNILMDVVDMNQNTNYGSFVSGAPGFQFWIDKCNFYLIKNIYPLDEFAIANNKLWLKLIDDRRDAYKALALFIEEVPELAIVLGFVRKIYIKQVNLLNYAYADNIVLDFKNGIFTKPDWLPEKCKKQIEILKKVKKLEEEALLHLKVAVRQIKESETVNFQVIH